MATTQSTTTSTNRSAGAKKAAATRSAAARKRSAAAKQAAREGRNADDLRPVAGAGDRHRHGGRDPSLLNANNAAATPSTTRPRVHANRMRNQNNP